MHPDMSSTYPLYQVPSGRIFCREGGGGYGFVGLIEMPRRIGTECMRLCRLNDNIWVDDQRARPAKDQQSMALQALGDLEPSHLLTTLGFAQSVLNDGLDCFVRTSFLPHEDPRMAWNIVVSAKKTRVSCMPQDGLYEFSNGVCKLISDNTYNGDSLGQQLKMPLWGPKGEYVLTSTMERNTYKDWIGPEQERNMAKDPLYKEFVLAMRALGEIPMYLTQTQYDAREKQAEKVMVKLLDEEDNGQDFANLQPNG